MQKNKKLTFADSNPDQESHGNIYFMKVARSKPIPGIYSQAYISGVRRKSAERKKKRIFIIKIDYKKGSRTTKNLSISSRVVSNPILRRTLPETPKKVWRGSQQ